MASRVYEKEMGITHAEFFRLLPVALGSDQYVTHSKGASLETDGRSVKIELGPESIRQIALLVIPRTPVTLILEEYSDTEAEDFLRTFDRAYQRGGG